MITDADIKKMKAVFATKDDLKSFATKNDLKSFATKEYVDKRFDRLFLYLDNRFEPLEKMKKDFDEFKDRVFVSLDWLVGAFTKFNEEHTVLTEQNKRIDKRLLSLEQRVMTP